MSARVSRGRKRNRGCEGGGRSRAGLLPGALLIALAALGAPGAARAACTGSTQTISEPVTGPIISNGGAITVTTNGSIAGNPDGVEATACAITTLSIQSPGSIEAGPGAAGASTGGAGGVGVLNENTITTLSNAWIINGGNGGNGGATGGAGGAGVSNSGTITTLTNGDSISGGSGGSGVVNGGAGGAGVSNSGTITTLTIGTPTNGASVNGGSGGGGAFGGAGGAGISNSGTITTLTNYSDIFGGLGGTGRTGNGALGDAIYSTGSIGSITNRGAIYGTVEIDNQASVTINGGSGGATGSIGGGAITIGNGDLAFTGNNALGAIQVLGENPALDNHIFVDGGAGKVTNEGVLSLYAPVTVTGNFVQTASSVLDFILRYGGALDVTKLATLDGELALDASGFPLMSGDVFDLMSYGGVSGAFTGLSLDGTACSATHSSDWFCSNVGLNFDVDVGSGGLDVTVSGVPEPATWALIGAGFLGLGVVRGVKGLFVRRSRKPTLFQSAL